MSDSDNSPSLSTNAADSLDVQLGGASQIANAMRRLREVNPDYAERVTTLMGTPGDRMPLLQLLVEGIRQFPDPQRALQRAVFNLIRALGSANTDPNFLRQLVEAIQPFDGPYDGNGMGRIAETFTSLGVDMNALVREGLARDDDHSHWAVMNFLRQKIDPALIVEALSHPSAYARRYALIHVPMREANPQVIERVIEIMLNDPDPELRISAAYNLAHVKKQSLLPVLREQIQQTEFHFVHGPIIKALTDLEDRPSMPDILHAMKLAEQRIGVAPRIDSEISILASGLRAIASMGDRSGLEIVLRQIQSRDPERRMDAVYALTALGKRDSAILPQAIPAIASLLTDDQRGYGPDVGLGTPVSQRAAEALQEIGTPEALAALNQRPEQ